MIRNAKKEKRLVSILNWLMFFSAIFIVVVLYTMVWARVFTGSWVGGLLPIDAIYIFDASFSVFLVSLSYKLLYPLPGSLLIISCFILSTISFSLLLPVEKFSLIHPEITNIRYVYALYPIFGSVGLILFIHGVQTLLSTRN